MHEPPVDISLPERSHLADVVLPVDDGDRLQARARLHERLFGHTEVRELGRYRLIDVLGRGGLGTVWRAHDRKLDREVALKLLHEDALRRPLRARRQLFAEAALMAKLNHPNVVRVYDLDEHEGELFVAMELVSGMTARSWQRQRERSWRELLDVYLAAGEGLAAAHRAQLVHGDFKPDNVLIGDDGRVLVTDFAVTRHVLEARLELELASTNADTPPDSGPDAETSRLRESTRSGSDSSESAAQLMPLVVGTPAYMAPEQFIGRLAEAAADQFAFCVALWEALAGERPFRGRTWAQLHAAVTRGPVREGRLPGPRMLWAALERGLSVDSGARWPSLEALLERLRQARDRRRRWAFIAAGAGLCGLGFAAAIPTLLSADDAQVVAVVQQCDPDEVPAELARSWTPARREAIGAAFGATGLPYAESAREHSLTRLEAWTQSWTDARALACRSTDASARTQLLCLDRNLASFTALVEVLAEADAGTVESVLELLERLPAADGCEQFELPRRLDPSDPDALQRHVQLGGAIERVRLLWLVGRTQTGLAEVEPLISAAERMQDDALLAETRSLRGLLRLDANVEGATDELFAAALAARRAGAFELEAEALISLAEAEAMRGEPRPERWLEQAAIAVELEPSPRSRAELASVRGVVANYRGDPVSARKWLEQALVELGDEPSYRRLTYMLNFGAILIELDEIERGSEILREVMQLATQQWPAGMPELGILHNNLAMAEFAGGQFEAAHEQYLRSHELLAAALGPEHVAVRTIRFNLALAESELGRCDAARERIDALLLELRASELSRAGASEGGGPLLPTVLVRRALLCGELDDRSLALADEALEHARAAFPAAGLGLARVAAHRGFVLVRTGDFVAAEQVFAELEPVFAAELDERSTDRAWSNIGYGLALAGQGKPEARARLELGLKWLGPRWVRERALAEAALDQLSKSLSSESDAG
jgi:serine/threonine protein kinase/tetratricopeptide (TPR) repeat protein